MNKKTLRNCHREWPSARSGVTALVIAGSLLLSSCANIPQRQTGFLNRYDMLQPIENHPGVSGYRISLTEYRKVYIEPITWKVQAAEDEALCDGDRIELSEALDSAMRVRMAPFAVVSEPGPGVLRIRAAITSVKPSSPGLNLALTALLIGPLNNGGAAVEIEAVDGKSNAQVAAISGSETGGFISTGGFSRIGHAREAVGHLGELFAERLH